MTISPNYPGEVFEISEREVLVVSIAYLLKLVRWMSSAYSVRTLMPRELCVVSKK
jgi:hypothetical protein